MREWRRIYGKVVRSFNILSDPNFGVMHGVVIGSQSIGMTMPDNKSSCCAPAIVLTSELGDTTTFTPIDEHVDVDMVALRGGWFQMGAHDSVHPEDGESPVRDVFLDQFSLAATAVTINCFAKFVQATGYCTVAERAGASFVFYQHCDTNKKYPAPKQAPWWREVEGACWHSPAGLSDNYVINDSHPVTHIAREDALAYCHWSGTRLATEAEWEFAARGDQINKPYPWGDVLIPNGNHQLNVWQGEFPMRNTCEDGYSGIAPVHAYGPHGFGHYNMLGNVWEWVADRFTNLHSPRATKNPTGPLNGSRFVVKGGSYLCHASYCSRYRTSSRQALPANTSADNIGFRVASHV